MSQTALPLYALAGAALTAALCLLIVVIRVIHVRRSVSIDDGEPGTLMKKARRTALVVWAVGSALYMGSAYLMTARLARHFLDDRAAYQAALASLKAQEFSNQFSMRIRDVETLATELASTLVLPPMLDGMAKSPPGAQHGNPVEDRLSFAIAARPERTAASVFSPEGTLLQQAGAKLVPGGRTERLVQAQVAHPEQRQKMGPFYLRHGLIEHPRLDFIAPVPAQSQSGPRPAFLVVSIDPSTDLFPSLERSPPSEQGVDVLFASVVGDEIVFATLHDSAPGLMLDTGRHLSMRSSALPVAQAYRTGQATAFVKDPSGNCVLATISRLPDQPWLAIVRSDVGKILAPLFLAVGAALLAGGATFVGIVLFATLAWSRQTLQFDDCLRRRKTELERVTANFGQLMRLTQSAVLLISPDGRIVEANARATTMYGYAIGELLGMTAGDLRAQQELDDFQARWAGTAAAEGVSYDTTHRRKDGTLFPVAIAISGIETAGLIYRRALIQDISDRQLLQAEIAQFARTDRLLRTSLAIFARAKDDADLFQRICNMLVDAGGYLLARIATPEGDGQKSLRTIAIAGDDKGYLDEAALTWAEVERGLGPSGTALRDGKIQVNNDFARNPRMAPWRNAALKRGIRSSIAIPLSISGRVFGLLGLYSERAHAFDDDEQHLLIELADNLSAAIERSSQRVAARSSNA